MEAVLCSLYCTVVTKRELSQKAKDQSLFLLSPMVLKDGSGAKE